MSVVQEPVSLESRIAAIEGMNDKLARENRWLKRLLVLVFVIGGTTCLVAARDNPPKTVEAERFILRDSKGKERGTLEMVDDSVHFTLRNAKEERRVHLAVGAEDHGAVAICGKDEKPVAVMGQNLDGSTVLLLLSDNSKAQFVVNAKNDGTAIIAHDENGKKRLELGAQSDITMIQYRSPDEKPRIQLGYHDDQPCLKFYEDQATPRLSLGIVKGSAGFAIRDLNEKDRVRIGTNKDGEPWIYLFNKDERPVFVKPD